MDDTDPGWSHSKEDADDTGNSRRIADDAEREDFDLRSGRSSKSRKRTNSVEADDQEDKRASYCDRSESRKRSGNSSHANNIDEEGREARGLQSLKVSKYSPVEMVERRLSEGYRDINGDNNMKRRGEESGWNTGETTSSYENSHLRSRSELEKPPDKDLKAVERHDTIRDKDHGHLEQEGMTHTRYGEAHEWNVESVWKHETLKDNYQQSTDSKWDDSKNCRNFEVRMEIQNETSSVPNAPEEAEFDAAKDGRHSGVNDKSRIYLDDAEIGYLHNTARQKEKGESIDQLELSHETYDKMELKINVDEDGRSIRKDGNHISASQIPDRLGSFPGDVRGNDQFLSDASIEQNFSTKDREQARADDRPNMGRNRNWAGKSREQEEFNEYWKRDLTRRNSNGGDDADMMDWRQQERLDGGNFHGRSGHRKESRLRSDSGNRYDSSDSIEIRPNRNLNFGREVPSSGRRADAGATHDPVSKPDEDKWGFPSEDRNKESYSSGADMLDRYHDGAPVDPNFGKTSLDFNPDVGVGYGGAAGPGQSVNGTTNSSLGDSPASSSLSRDSQQGTKGARPARGGRIRSNWRDAQRPPFANLGLPPTPVQPMGPNIPHNAGPSLQPGVYIPPFPSPVLWPGGRGIDVNMLAVAPNLPPIAPLPAAAGFGPNSGVISTHPMHISQPNSGIVMMSGSDYNPKGSTGRDMPIEKAQGGWMPTRSNTPAGKAPSRGEQNDYSQNFVDTGMRPQNFIRELELTSVVEDYPKLRELIQRKDEIVAKSATPPMYYKCDLRDHALSPDFFGTKFDVILIDPPWEEYIHRAPGITDHIEYWNCEEIMNLKIEAIADTPSFIFLWVGDGVGLEQGRQCLKKWGFRRCEDICWVKTNKKIATPGLRHDSRTLFQHSKEHCLMGIKGTVRRSTDGHVIHANIDTDVIIAEEPPDGSTKKPEDMYRIIEHFALGRRRLELFGEDHNIRPGWLTLGKGLSSSNYNREAYVRNFADKDGKVWQGSGGRNPPPEAPHLVVTTPEIEGLRPKSPPQKGQQQPLPPLGPGGSSSRRSSGNSPQNNVTVIGSESSTPAHWSSSPMIGFDGGHGPHFL